PNQTFLMENVLLGTQPVILKDTREAPNWIWTPFGKHIRSWMGVPLRVKGNIIGLFSLDKSTPDYFTSKHAELALALAKHAALALENASLFTQLQNAHKELHALSVKLINTQENERQKISLELHDHTGQALLALRAELQVLRHYLSSDITKGFQQIDYLDQIVIELNKELEQLVYDLRPPTLTTFGLIPVLEQYISDFGKRLRIDTHFVYDANIPRFTDEIELTCYRIVQEALTNIAKYANATSITVTINVFEGLMHLVVKDNGRGFISSKQGERKGFGLLGIRERLSQIGGSLEVNSYPNKGTELIATIPFLVSEVLE
ncbi:MAG: GAF domain-containing sensor histidine kinase, partial [Anaerolineales bacterium]